MDNVADVRYGFVDENNVLKYVFYIKENDFTTLDRLKNEFPCSAAYQIKLEKEGSSIGDTIWNGKAFSHPSPHASWIFNENLFDWEPPFEKPDSGNWKWDEDTISWVEVDLEDLSDTSS